MRTAIRAGRLSAVHDLSDGGLLVAVAEMAMGSENGTIGATLTASGDLPLHAWAFGEDQACYAVTMAADNVDAFLNDAQKAGVPAGVIGTTGGSSLTVEGSAPISLARLIETHEAWLPTYMAAPETH